MDFTIITAVTPDYESKLRLTLPTWKIKPQFSNQPMIIFCKGYNNPQDHFKTIWNNARIISWDLKMGETQREIMLSSFILGAAQYIDTPYYCKIDGDSFFCNSENLFEAEDLEYDLCAPGWGYSLTKHLIKLKSWVENQKIPGDCPFDKIDIIPDTRATRHRRICSWCCMHKTDFVKEVVGYIGTEKLPCPSHDTTLWYFAERLPHRRWKTKKLKNLGALTKTHISSIKKCLKDKI